MPTSLHHGDWLTLAAALPPASIDFIYADPPFNTGKDRTDDAGSYPDAWDTPAAHIAWLKERIAATLAALSDRGTILIHVDWRTSHLVRCLLDDLLGPTNFVNHLIWSYGLGGSSPRRFARKHDDLIVYCRDPELYYFDPPMVPATSRRMAGQLKKATDVLDIPSINNMAAERVGYPTQKPLALLDLLVRAFCPPDGQVLDPCCGSGTTLAAAAAAGRSAIGFDISQNAIAVAQRRLQARLHTADTPAQPKVHEG